MAAIAEEERQEIANTSSIARENEHACRRKKHTANERKCTHVGRVKRVEIHKAKTLGFAIVRVAHDARNLHTAERGKRVVQQLVVHLLVEAADEQVGADLDVALLLVGLGEQGKIPGKTQTFDGQVNTLGR
jgi:hypothetical protein